MLQFAMAMAISEFSFLLISFARACHTDDNASHSSHLQNMFTDFSWHWCQGKYKTLFRIFHAISTITYPDSKNSTKWCLLAIFSSTFCSVRLMTLVIFSCSILDKTCLPSTNDVRKHIAIINVAPSIVIGDGRKCHESNS